MAAGSRDLAAQIAHASKGFATSPTPRPTTSAIIAFKDVIVITVSMPEITRPSPRTWYRHSSVISKSSYLKALPGIPNGQRSVKRGRRDCKFHSLILETFPVN